MIVKNLIKNKLRKIVFKSLIEKNINLPKDTKFKKDVIEKFNYIQYWESESENKIYTAICNILKPKGTIYFVI